MTTTERFFLLPPRIDYAGFTFHLQFTEHRQYGIGLAYVLTGCHSNKRYKRQAWKDGYWEDRAAPRQISTMFSNYLFYEPCSTARKPASSKRSLHCTNVCSAPISCPPTLTAGIWTMKT